MMAWEKSNVIGSKRKREYMFQPSPRRFVQLNFNLCNSERKSLTLDVIFRQRGAGCENRLELLRLRLTVKISIIFGTRPEAIKLAPVILTMRKDARFKCRVCVTA